jgi:histidine triad (HIT) family protein
MYNHKPDNYICPFCLVSHGIENEHVITKQEDIIYHDDTITAFIASRCWKNNKGHVLIIPNEHYENIYELPSSISSRIHDLEKEIALAFKEVYKCDGVSSRQHNEPCGDQDVWHYHLHVFPRYAGDNLYKTEKELLPSQERKAFAEKLRAYFNNRPLDSVKYKKTT